MNFRLEFDSVLSVLYLLQNCIPFKVLMPHTYEIIFASLLFKNSSLIARAIKVTLIAMKPER